MSPVDDYVRVGPPSRLQQLLDEYGVDRRDVADLVHVETVRQGAVGRWTEERAYIHKGLLRPHGEYPCAGDQEALEFLREIAAIMISQFGIAQPEAIARINRHWSEPVDGMSSPRVWIVGLDIAYHESAENWASAIYYGDASGWWRPGANPEPLPPPSP